MLSSKDSINGHKFVSTNSNIKLFDMKRLIFFGLMAFTLGASFDKEKGVKTSTASYYHTGCAVSAGLACRFRRSR